MMNLKTGWIESFDGTRIYYEQRGEGPAIIMCNGILCRMTTYWQPAVSFLAASRRAITWDYRGHGRSTLPRNPAHCTMDDFCQDLTAVMDHLGTERAVLAGHSLGSQLIFEAWRQMPERIAGLISICGSYERPFRTFYNTAFFEHLFKPLCHLAQIFHLPTKLAARLLRHSLIPQILARSGPAHWLLCPWNTIEDYTDHLANLDYRFAFGALAELATHSAADVLPDIDVPVLVIVGERDPFVPPKVGLAMHGQIRDSELLVVSLGSHTVLVEQPQFINYRMDMFLKERVENSIPSTQGTR